MLVKVVLPSGHEAVFEIESLLRDGRRITETEVRWYHKHVATKFSDGWRVYAGEQGWNDVVSPEDIRRYEALVTIYDDPKDPQV